MSLLRIGLPGGSIVVVVTVKLSAFESPLSAPISSRTRAMIVALPVGSPVDGTAITSCPGLACLISATTAGRLCTPDTNRTEFSFAFGLNPVPLIVTWERGGPWLGVNPLNFGIGIVFCKIVSPTGALGSERTPVFVSTTATSTVTAPAPTLGNLIWRAALFEASLTTRISEGGK